MFNAADYRPRPPDHRRCELGAPAGRHVHVTNHMFDHPTLVAVVVPGGSGYQAKVVPGSTCERCATEER